MINGSILTRKFEMFETVYNTEKDKLQMVISEIPFCKRAACGLRKMERAYICGEPGTNIWSIELGKNLRRATIFDRKK